MRTWLLVVSLVAAACGRVSVPAAPADAAGAAGGKIGAACSQPSDCENDMCSPDGVCCDEACTGTCEACAASKTGQADGTCAPITANTDPDDECAAACADGQLTSMCDGHGACAVTTCSGYQCDPSGASCLAACARSSDCIDADYCSGSACVKRLRVALVAGSGSCIDAPGDAFTVAAGLLAGRGHDPVFALDTDIDTPAKIAAFDVVVLGGPGNGCTAVGWSTYDGVLTGYVNNGGGLVAAGWTLYNEADSTPSAAPNMIALMPNTGTAFLSGAETVTPAGTDPISTGLAAFATTSYLPYGSTTPKAGATVIASSGATPVAESWTVGNGRAVYLGPLYFEEYASYSNQALMNGTEASAVEFMLRSVEWAGHER